jgi:uncharacterized membrane protein
MTSDPKPLGIEHAIARLLGIGTAISIALLAIGFLLLIAGGGGPRTPEPPFDLGRLPGDILALRPAGVIWLGLLVALVTPSARVLAALIGYVRTGERDMTIVSVLILAVIAVSVIAARALEG